MAILPLMACIEKDLLGCEEAEAGLVPLLFPPTAPKTGKFSAQEMSTDCRGSGGRASCIRAMAAASSSNLK